MVSTRSVVEQGGGGVGSRGGARTPARTPMTGMPTGEVEADPADGVEAGEGAADEADAFSGGGGRRCGRLGERRGVGEAG